MAIDSEKYKELYQFQKNQFEDERTRFNRLEDKAMKYLSSLTISVSAYLLVVRWSAEKVILPSNWLDWIVIISIIITIVAFVSAWSFIFRSIQLQDLIKLPSDNLMIEYFKKNKKETVYLGLAKRYSEASEKLSKEYDKKLKYVKKGYKVIIFASWCFLISIFLIFANLWSQ